ncbi:MAG: universal stress protein [Bacillota bacterium]|nr:universal stress protein [Bacillota bacterium]
MRVLIAVDGSEGSRKALAMANRLLREVSKPEVILLHVQVNPRLLDYIGSSPELWAKIQEAAQEAEREADRILAESRAALQLLETTPEVILRRGDPASEIVAAARERNVDLIIMGARGLGKIAELLLGSVSDRVLHLAPCPVMIVR